MSFSDDLQAAKALATPHEDVNVMLNDNLYTFRFYQMSGIDWADAVDRHPLRAGVAFDSQYGYNLRTLTRYVAPKCGHLLVGGQERDLKVVADPDNPDEFLVNEWADFFAGLSGHFETKIGDAIYNLNEYKPHVATAKAVTALKKAQAGSGKSST